MSKRFLPNLHKPAIRLLSFSLVFALVLSAIPFEVFAQNGLGTPVTYAEADPSSSPDPPPPDFPDPPPDWPPTDSPPPPESTPAAPTPRPVSLPTVATLPASDIQPTSAALNGSILDNGGGDIMGYQFYWYSPDGLEHMAFADSSFSAVITGLSPNTSYMFIAYAINEAGTSYGSWQTFRTPFAPLAISTLEATDLGYDRVVLNGKVSGGENVYASGFSIISPSFRSISAVPDSDGLIKAEVTGLKPGVTYVYNACATDVKGRIYGSKLSFTTLKAVPKVSASSAPEVSTITARLLGSILDKGSSDVKEAGFLWGSDPKPNVRLVCGVSANFEFQSLLEKLKPDTTYYFQAYASNSEGTGYGPVMSFITLKGNPTVETLKADGVTPVEANLNGSVTNGDELADIKLPVSESGFLYGTGPKPDLKVKVTPGLDKKTLAYSLKKLKPNTTYYFQAYAANSMGTFYGKIESFKTADGLPLVSTSPADQIKPSGAALQGMVDNAAELDNQGLGITDCGFLWGTDPKPDKKASVPSHNYDNAYDLKGLKANTVYYFQAYATNAAGTGYGEVLSFTTAKGEPVVAASPASGIKPDGAVIGGVIKDDKGFPVTDSGFFWGPSKVWDGYEGGPPPKGVQQTHVAPDSDKGLTFSLTGLDPNGDYRFMAYAVNEAGTGFSEVMAFQTFTVTTLDATDAAGRTVVLHGSVAAPSDCLFTASGFLYGKGSDISNYTRVSSDSAPDSAGNFSVTLKDLSPITSYNFIAFAATGAGEITGESLSFTTLTNAPLVETREVSGLTTESVVLNGSIVSDRGLDVTESGFLWGKNSRPDTKLSASPGSDGSALSAKLTGLEPGAVYYYQAYAVSSDGTGMGAILSFVVPAVAPKVDTVSSIFNPADWAVELKGSIVSNGGALLTGYGFRYSADQKNWTELAVGQGNCDGDFAGSLSGLNNNLRPGSKYYVQAYASNKAGTGYGPTVSFTVPGAPTVSADFKKPVLSNKATLTGTITGTGGDDVVCTARRFQYREAAWAYVYVIEGYIGKWQWQWVGKGDWITIGTEDGSFKAGDVFSCVIPNLKTAWGYYFRAQAYTPAGWGSSQDILLVTGWGDSDTEAAANMAAAGWNPVDIANAMKNTYGDTDTAAFRALLYAGFSPGDAIGGLTAYNSAYRSGPADVARVCSENGIDLAATFTIIYNLRRWRGSYEAVGDAVYYTIRVGYKADDIVGILKNSFNYPLDQVYDTCASFGRNAINISVAHVYGREALAAYLWSRYRYDWNGLCEVARDLKNSIDMDALQCAALLQGVYPSMTARQFAGACKEAGFSAADTGAALIRVYNADEAAVADALVHTGVGPFGIAGIEDFLYNGMNCSASRMVWIITNIFGSATNTYNEIARVLKDFYGMDAVSALKAMYAAGWTEANYGQGANSGYGLNQAISILESSFGVQTADGLVNALKEIGLSPVALAQYMSGLYGKGLTVGSYGRNWDAYWMSAYRNQGYPAADAVTFCKSQRSYNDIGSTFKLLFQSGYAINDIVLAVKNAYNPDSVTAFNEIKKTNSFFNLGLNDKAIQDAITFAWGADPILTTILAMKNAGSTAAQAAGALRYSFNITGAAEVAGYLSDAGYGDKDVLAGLEDVFYGRALSKDTAAGLAAILRDVLKQSPPDMNLVYHVMLAARGSDDPVHASRDLDAQNYSFREIVQLLRDVYSQDAIQTIDVLLTKSSIFSWNEAPAIMAAVMEVFGLDTAGVVSLLKGTGYTAVQAAKALKDQFGVDDSGAAASIMAAVGYGETDVLTALFNTYFSGPKTRSMLEGLYYIDKQVFNSGSMGAALRVMGCNEALQAASLMKTFGYEMTDIARTLKDGYSQTAFQAADAMMHCYGALKEQDVMKAVMAVFGMDISSYALYLKQSGKTAFEAANLLKRQFAVTGPADATSYLAGAGYGMNDVLSALLDTYYSGSASSSAQFQELNSILQQVYGKVTDDVAASMLKAAGVTTPSGAVSALNRAGYPLNVIVRVLKNTYNVNAAQATALLTESGLFSQADIAAQVQSVFGGDYVLIFIQYWQNSGYGIDSVFRSLSDRLGITDNVIRINYLRQAGYSDNDIWDTVAANCRDNLIQIIAGIYGISDPVSAGRQYKLLAQQVPSIGESTGIQTLLTQIPQVFPGTDTVTIVKTLVTAGFPVYGGSGQDIFGWLRSNHGNGKPDDALAAILGPSGADALGLDGRDAVEIMYGMGYGMTDTVAWMLKDKYAWADFFPGIVFNYGSYTQPKYGEWASSAMPVLKTLIGLKDSNGERLYTLQDLALGDLAYYKSSGESDLNYYDVFSDLLYLGISEDNSVEVMLTLRGGGEMMKGLISILEEKAVDPYHRSSATHIAGVVAAALVNVESAYNPDPKNPSAVSPLITDGIINPPVPNPDGTYPKLGVTLKDIVQGLIGNGPNSDGIPWFSWDEVYQALCAIDAPYLAAIGADLPPDIGALQLLKAAGMPADDAIAIEEAEGVGLGSLDLFETFIGFDSPWMEAVTNVAAAGYGYTESINALMRNQTYRMVLGTSLLTSILTNSSIMKGLGAATIVTRGKTVYDMCVKLGWAIEKTVVGEYKSAGVKYGLFGVSAAGLVYSLL